jgi:hypothetical protein
MTEMEATTFPRPLPDHLWRRVHGEVLTFLERHAVTDLQVMLAVSSVDHPDADNGPFCPRGTIPHDLPDLIREYEVCGFRFGHDDLLPDGGRRLSVHDQVLS